MFNWLKRSNGVDLSMINKLLAVQNISTATIGRLLIEKGIVTQAEFDAKFREIAEANGFIVSDTSANQ